MPDKQRALVFFDDHQAAPRRVREARERGFVHLVMDDNYPPPWGDNLGPMQASSGPALWGRHRLQYLDNFGKTRRPMSAQELEGVGQAFRENVEVYSTSPPLWVLEKHRFHPHPEQLLKRPLFEGREAEEYQEQYPKRFWAFNWMCYVRLKG